MSHWVALVVCIFANVGCNIAFKRVVDTVDVSSLWRLNGGLLSEISLWAGVVLAGIALAGYLYAIRIVPLSIAYSLVTSLSIVMIAIAGPFLFDENISIKQIGGFALIITGIVLVFET